MVNASALPDAPKIGKVGPSNSPHVRHLFNSHIVILGTAYTPLIDSPAACFVHDQTIRHDEQVSGRLFRANSTDEWVLGESDAGDWRVWSVGMERAAIRARSSYHVAAIIGVPRVRYELLSFLPTEPERSQRSACTTAPHDGFAFPLGNSLNALSAAARRFSSAFLSKALSSDFKYAFMSIGLGLPTLTLLSHSPRTLG